MEGGAWVVEVESGKSSSIGMVGWEERHGQAGWEMAKAP